MNHKQRPSVFHYSNYREFIKDSYTYLAAHDSSITTRKFAKIAGLRSHSHINLIVQGSRNISEDVSIKIAEAFDLNSKERKYFQCLVLFNQAETEENKEIIWQKIIRLLGLTSSQNFTQDHFRIFVSWKIPTLFEAMQTSFFNGTKKDLVRILNSILTNEEIEIGIETLKGLNLIEVIGDSVKIKDQSNIVSPDAVPFEIFYGYHKSLFDLAAEALKIYPEEERFFTGLTVALSENGYSKLQKVVRELESEVAEIQKKDQEASGVFQLSIQVFPIINSPKK
jgi:uncharacterized protein (TIGR02147 family)